MTTRSSGRLGLTWKRLVLAAAGLGAVAAAVGLGRYAVFPRAEAAPPASAESVPPPAPPPAAETSDYSRRVVAYIYTNTPVTREQLGEYLIARYGPDKVNHLVNKLIIEKACTERGITVTDAEVDAQLAQDLASCKINKREFVANVLRQYRKNLYEWREDVLRPKLLMTKLLREQVRVGEEDLRKAFESYYGEKLGCKGILWPVSEHDKLRSMYEKLLKDPDEFDRVARTQNISRLLPVGGMLEPFGRYGLGADDVEKVAFSLKPGEMTPLMKISLPGEGEFCVILKLLQRFPPNTTVKFADVRADLEKEILDRKVQELVPATMEQMRRAADPKILLTEYGQRGRPDDPVAYIYGTIPVTREQLGEYLITRYGADKVDFLINHLIIERASAEKGVTVSDAEVEETASQQLAILKVDGPTFEKEILKPNRTNLYEWKQDILRPQLLMAKLLRDTVRVEPEDLRKGFEAYHGEKVQCQLILWPRTPRDREIAIKEYARIRKDPAEFDRVARMQANPRLAAMGGKIEPFGRYSTGSENVEREVFNLREGEITPLLETPEGYAVFKLLKRHPARTDVKLEQVREQLEKEIIARKVQMETPAAFQKMREAAAPNIILRSAVREEDLEREVKKEMEAAKAPGGK